MKNNLLALMTGITLLSSPNAMGMKKKSNLKNQKISGIVALLQKAPTKRILHELPVTLCDFVQNNTYIDFKTHDSNKKIAGAELYNKKVIVTAQTPNAEYYPDFLFNTKNSAIFAIVNYLKKNKTSTICYDLNRNNIIRATFKGGEKAGFASDNLCVPMRSLFAAEVFQITNGDTDLLQFRAKILHTDTSPNGQNMFFITTDGLLHLYHGKTGHILTNPCTTNVEFSSDSKYLLYDHDKTICLYDIKKQKEIPIMCVDETLSTLEFSPNGDFIIFTADAKTYYYYNIKKNEAIGFNYQGTAIPDGSSEDGTVLTYQLQTNGQFSNIALLYDPTSNKAHPIVCSKIPLRIRLNKDNSLVLISLSDGETVELYEYPSLKKYDTITMPGEDIISVPHLSPDNSAITVVSDETGTCKVYNVKKKKIIKTSKIAYFNFAHALKYHPTQPLIFIATDYNTLEVYNYKTGQSFQLSSNVEITAFNLRDDGNLLVLSFGKMSLLYDLSQKQTDLKFYNYGTNQKHTIKHEEKSII